MTTTLYTARDVCRCFPWMSPGAVNHRVKKGYIKISHPSTGTGIPNMFRLPELVHCGVIDELATLGALNDLKRVIATTYEMVSQRFVTEKPFKVIHPGGKEELTTDFTFPPSLTYVYLPEPFALDVSFYERFGYHVVVAVLLLHESHFSDPEAFAMNMPDRPPGPDRFYQIIYAPEINERDQRPTVDREVEKWFNSQDVRDGFSLGFISVFRLYRLACSVLGLP